MGNPVALPLVLAATSALISAFKWKSTPDRVPFWWDLDGHPVAWVPKWLGLFALPVLQLVIPYVLYQFASRDRDLHRQGGEAKHAAAHIITVPALFLFCVHVLVLPGSATLGDEFHPRILVACVALWLLFWFGYNVQYVELNSSIGILTPWTVANATTWSRTQSHASFILMLAGVILFVVALVCPLGTGLFVATLVLLIAPFVYFQVFSYFISSEQSERLLP